MQPKLHVVDVAGVQSCVVEQHRAHTHEGLHGLRGDTGRQGLQRHQERVVLAQRAFIHFLQESGRLMSHPFRSLLINSFDSCGLFAVQRLIDILVAFVAHAANVNSVVNGFVYLLVPIFFATVGHGCAAAHQIAFLIVFERVCINEHVQVIPNVAAVRLFISIEQRRRYDHIHETHGGEQILILTGVRRSGDDDVAS